MMKALENFNSLPAKRKDAIVTRVALATFAATVIAHHIAEILP